MALAVWAMWTADANHHLAPEDLIKDCLVIASVKFCRMEAKADVIERR